VIWSPAFIDLVLRFANRAADVAGVPIAESLLRFTPLYLNFDLGRSFDPANATWQEFLTGYRCASDPTDWTHSFYLAHARVYPESVFGCFSYHYESEARCIRLHFGNRDSSTHGPLSDARQQNRLDELRALFTNVRVDQPEAQVVRGRSWMYHLAAYRRLFPAAYVETAVPANVELQFMSLWGQFLDRTGSVRLEPALVFSGRMAAATTLEELTASFPLCVLAPQCNIQPFFTFYGE
jgi:hypothetical protein